MSQKRSIGIGKSRFQPKTCDKCGQTINAGDETYKQGSRFYHPTCDWNREKHFEKLLSLRESETALSDSEIQVDYIAVKQKYHMDSIRRRQQELAEITFKGCSPEAKKVNHLAFFLLDNRRKKQI